jgi:flagellar basal body-associated protein FliL
MNLLGIVLYSFMGVLLLGLAVVIWWLVDTVSLSSTQAKSSTSKNNRQKLPTSQNQQSSTSKNNHQKLPTSQNQLFYLERELLTLVNGDKALATRLLLNIRLRNPQRSKSWCYEKVIYDLKRDRGGI